MASGFEPIADYYSAAVDDLTHREDRLTRVCDRLDRQGVRIRNLDLDRFDQELRSLHNLSVETFQNNFLYTPIEQGRFLSMYRPIREMLLPELVLLAEAEGELVGFVFGVPDLAQAQRGRPVDTVIVKTVAALPGRAWAGLGHLLVERCHLAAHKAGYRRAIHALMHESNKSMNLSARYGKPFRRYALYARSL